MVHNRFPRFIVSLAIPALLLLAPATGLATIWTVTDLGDTGAAGQLRTLMSGAAAGDTIVIPPGTIVLTGASGDDLNASGDLDIRRDLTIVGSGPTLTVLDGGGVDGVLDVRLGTSVVANVAIRNGIPGDPTEGGGGVRVVAGATLTLINVVVSDNVSNGGGGIYNEAGTVMLIGATVRDNRTRGATAIGAGILNFGDDDIGVATMQISHSTIRRNRTEGKSASANGGGIANAGSSLGIVNSTVSGNEAVANTGGGIFQTATGAGVLDLRNVTIADNLADSDGSGTPSAFGGGLSIASGVVSMLNSIIAGNGFGGAGVGRDCHVGSTAILLTLGFNLLQKSCTILGGGAFGPDDLLDVPARLTPLAENGGPTATHALKRNSPAVDAGGSCPAIDQRGVSRPADGDRRGGPACDIGAFELE